MELIMHRTQTHHAPQQEDEFEFTLHIQAQFTEQEIQLLKKYHGWQKEYQFIKDDYDLSDTTGTFAIVPQTLADPGLTWSSKHHLSEVIQFLPQVIGQGFKIIFESLDDRETWGAANAHTSILIEKGFLGEEHGSGYLISS